MRTSRSTRLLSGTASDPPRLRACELRARHQTATRGGPGGGSPRGRGGVADGFRDSLDDATAVGVQPLDCTLLNTLFWLLLFDTLVAPAPGQLRTPEQHFVSPAGPCPPPAVGVATARACARAARAPQCGYCNICKHTRSTPRSGHVTSRPASRMVTRSARWYEVSLSRGYYGSR